MDNQFISEPVSLIFLGILLISAVSNIRNSTKEYKFFVSSIIFAFLANISNLFATPGVFTSMAGVGDTAIIFFNFLGYLFLPLSIVVLVMYFIYSFTDEYIPYLKLRLISVIGPFSCYLVLLISNIWTRLLFDVVEGEYIRGKLFVVPFILCAIFFILIPVLGFLGKKSNRVNVIPICSFSAVAIVLVIIQVIYPSILLVDTGVASVLYIFYMNLLTQNKDRDPSTDVYTRRALIGRLDKEISKNSNAEILYFSIFNMKNIVSDYGGLAGETLVKSLLRRLEGISRQATFYKIVTYEFCIVLSNKEEDKEKFLEQLIFELKQPMYINGYLVDIDFFIAKMAVKDVDTDSNSAIRILNFMINSCRESSDKEYVIEFEPKYLDLLRVQEKMERFVLERITNKKIEMYYQPIYCVASPQTMKSEALIRVKDDNGKFVPPDVFLPVVRKIGFAYKITEIVTEIVAKFCVKCKDEEINMYSVAVNVSPSEIIKPGYAEKIINLSDKLEVDLQKLALEITEDILIEEKDNVAEVIQKLKVKGVQFSLDDFGVQYSNITTMFSFPFSIIKIDKEVFWETFANGKFNDFFKILIHGLKSSGYKVLVEGVENEEQFQYCLKNGIDYIQGYYYSKPLPESEYIEFIMENSK